MRLGTVSLLAVSPLAVSSEAAAFGFNRRGSLACDAVGLSAPSDEVVDFELDPVDVGMHGEGEYTINYGDSSASAVHVPRGPMVTWAALENTLNMLTFSGYWAPETDMRQVRAVWQTLGPMDLSLTPFRFMTCEVTE